MKRLIATVLLLCGFALNANADIWKWVDASGKTHFVDTTTPIYMWVDEFGKVNYSDTPDHEDAVSVELVWVSPGSLSEAEGGDKGGDEEASNSGGYANAGETAEERAEREQAEAYYCKRATEIYDSYVNAPQLYRTDEGGEREYLSKKEGEAIIAETKAKKDELCK
jgi:hypothetical protein